MARAATLGIDVGTQGTKALLVACADGAVIGRGAVAHAPLPPSAVGRAEQDPREWRAAAVGAVRAALAQAGAVDVIAIGVSGQQHGCVLVDAANEPIGAARLWCDTETHAEAAELERRLGRALPVGWTASKVLHAVRHRPADWARADGVLLPHEWLNAQLCGVRAAEPGDASGTGWLDPRTRRYDPAALAAIDPGLERRLPPLVASDQLIGRLRAPLAQAFGLPEGVPIAAGGGDNMMSAIGAGAAADGVMVASLGTSATLFARSAQAVIDERALLSPFCDSAGAWLPLLCLQNCTGVTEELRRSFSLSHAEFDAQALAAPCGGDGLLFIPWLVGERVPALPRATGALLGVRAGMLAPGPLGRAAVEGVAHGLALGLARMRCFGLAPREVRLVGGAAGSPLWTRVLADSFGLPVVPLAEHEAAALGAALQAQWAVRRAAREAVDLGELAARRAGTLTPVLPDEAAVAVLAAARERFAGWIEREHGAAHRPDRR